MTPSLVQQGATTQGLNDRSCWSPVSGNLWSCAEHIRSNMSHARFGPQPVMASNHPSHAAVERKGVVRRQVG